MNANGEKVIHMIPLDDDGCIIANNGAATATTNTSICRSSLSRVAEHRQERSLLRSPDTTSDRRSSTAISTGTGLRLNSNKSEHSPVPVFGTSTGVNRGTGRKNSKEHSASSSAFLPTLPPLSPPQHLSVLDGALAALRDMQESTRRIGMTVLMEEAIHLNNKRLRNGQHDYANKKMKRETNADDNNGNNVAANVGSISVAYLPTSNNGGFDDEGSGQILRQALRMKRLTTMFRNISDLQTLILREVKDCRTDHEVSASSKRYNK